MTNAPISQAAWRALAEKTLGRAPPAGPGLTHVAPLYERNKETVSRPWRAKADWAVAQRIDHPDAEIANATALRDLEGGADALTLVFDSSPFAHGFGMPLDEETFDVALAGIELDLIELRFDAGSGTAHAARWLETLAKARRLTSAGLAVDLGYNPIGTTARGFPVSDDLPAILDHAKGAGLAGRIMLADGRAYHEAGGSESQELAAIIATAVAYLRRLVQCGHTLDAARRMIAFHLAVDADMFLGLAKVRALRRLWARVEQASGLTPEPIRLHAETSWRMMTRRDVWTNAMRTTVAASAAGLGGADTVTVLPMTLPLGLPDDAARRLARNTQRILLEESNLGRVDDPAAGSGGFDALTDTMCDEAWTLFQSIEREGGMAASLKDGSLRATIAQTAHWRAGRFATLRDGITGTSKFPALQAHEPSVLPVSPRSSSCGADALPSARDAEPFEALLDAAEALPARPRVFLATLGRPASFGNRATYAANFFAIAGIATVGAAVKRDIAALVADFAISKTHVACLCGLDDAYEDDAVALAKALRMAGARHLLLVGPPASDNHAGRLAEIDALIHDGCAALDILNAALAASANG